MDTQNHYYRAFGLTWQMPLVCPELPQVAFGAPEESTPQDIKPDVIVRYGTIPQRPDGLQAAGPLRQVAPNDARFGLPDVARFWVRNGQEIVIERRANAKDEMVRMLLVGTGAALLLHQRAVLPLHASGVVTPQGHAILFMGHSGMGKSTLLGAFLRRGYPMLCEDLAAIHVDASGRASVEPGVQITKLWADSAAELAVATDGLPRVRPELSKFMAPVAEHLVREPARLHSIYVLGFRKDPQIHLEERRDVHKFNALLNHTWQKLTVKRMGLHGTHFQNAITVANQTRIVRVLRPDPPRSDNEPPGLFRLDELVQCIEADFNHADTLERDPAA